jgi:hypothetical protein
MEKTKETASYDDDNNRNVFETKRNKQISLSWIFGTASVAAMWKVKIHTVACTAIAMQ